MVVIKDDCNVRGMFWKASLTSTTDIFHSMQLMEVLVQAWDEIIWMLCGLIKGLRGSEQILIFPCLVGVRPLPPYNHV